MLQKSILLASAVGGARALTMRRSGCSFHLRTEGIISAPVSQYGSGQTRAGLNETASSFTINGGTFVDSQNRGCWWTPPALVLQCDVGQIPETGFSIGCDGTVSYNGQSTFYSCDTGADGLYMIYSAPNGSQCGEITLIADSCYPNTCNGTGTATSSGTSASGSSSTGSLPLGSGTPSSQLTGSTSAGSSYPGETGTALSASSGTGTDTLPLASLTSFGVFPYPTEGASTPASGGNTPSGGASGSSYPGEGTPTGGSASTFPGESTPGSETIPTNSGGGNTQTYPVGSIPSSESTSTYPGGEGTATYPGGSTPGSESTATGGSTPAAGGSTSASESTVTYESTLTYPVGSTPGSESTATYPGGESTPTGGNTSPGSSYPVGSSTGKTPATSSYPGGSYPGGSYPVGSSTGSSSAGSTPASGYPTNSYPGTSTSSSTSSTSSSTGTPGPGESCPGYLSGAYQYPHLIIPVDSSNADSAPGTSYFGEVTSTVSSAFNFDIPQSASGKTCNLVFYFPTQSQLETSSYNFTGSGVVDFSRLSTVVTASTSYSNLPSVSKSYGEQTLAPGSGYDITSFSCPAGEAIAFEISAAEGDTSTNFRYFQDWNPCPLGLFITVS